MQGTFQIYSEIVSNSWRNGVTMALFDWENKTRWNGGRFFVIYFIRNSRLIFGFILRCNQIQLLAYQIPLVLFYKSTDVQWMRRVSHQSNFKETLAHFKLELLWHLKYNSGRETLENEPFAKHHENAGLSVKKTLLPAYIYKTRNWNWCLIEQGNSEFDLNLKLKAKFVVKFAKCYLR